MNDDDLDRRLSAAGEAWRDSHELPEVELPAERRRPAWVLPVAAAASVALLAGGVTLAASQLDRDTRSDPPPAAEQGERWDPDLPVGLVPAKIPDAVEPVNQPVEFPAAEVAGSYSPRLTDTVGQPACSASDVRFGIARGQGAQEVEFRLEVAGDDTTCVVSRYPFQQYTRDGKPVEVLTRTWDPGTGDWPAAVLITPDRPAVLWTSWVGWCGDPGFDTVEMFFDDNSVKRLKVEGQLAACTGDVKSGFEKMRMIGWEPEGFSVRAPGSFAGLKARLVDEVKGPGGLPTWVVELTATKDDIDLATCPSWEVRQGDQEAASWRLNCDEVPFHHAGGTPYLKAGEPVRFAIWTSYGDTDAAQTWVLRTPEGQITVPLSEGPKAPSGEPRIVDEDAANLHLWLSNQSFEDAEVHLAVTVDGVQLVEDDFAVEGQHNFVQFHLALEPGRHTMVVTSDRGTSIERTITIPERGDRWAAALYWCCGPESTGSLDWMFQDTPIGWA